MKYRAVLLGYPYFLDSVLLAGGHRIVGLIIDRVDGFAYRGMVDIARFGTTPSGLRGASPSWRSSSESRASLAGFSGHRIWCLAGFLIF
jgi:hypothetical protein